MIVETIIDATDSEERIVGLFHSLGFSKHSLDSIWILVSILTLLLGVTIGVLVIVWLERKISAGIQQRIGPEYAGPLGIIQALADGIKLLLKEDIIPAGGDTWLFNTGPAVVVTPIFLSFLVVPFGKHIILTDLGIGIFFWVAVSSIAPLGLLMAGYGSNNKYSFLGGLRAAAQSTSYEIPLALCVLSISLRAIRYEECFHLPGKTIHWVIGQYLWENYFINPIPPQPDNWIVIWVRSNS